MRIFLLVLASSLVVRAVPIHADWPSFRGPHASGIAEAATPPATWDIPARRNVRWRMPIPGLSHASPIVWGDRVYAITAIADAPSDLDMKAEGVVFAKDTVRHTWRLIAFDRTTGREAWNRVAHQGTPAQPRHVRGTHANATPATDGRTIVAVLGNEGLFAFDMNGASKWRVPMAPATASWSLDPASSPIVFGGLAIVQSDFQQQGFLAAYDLETGRERWRVARDEGLTWSTPTIWKPSDGPAQLVVNSGRWIRSYEPSTGRQIWRLNNEAKGSWDRVATPIAAGNLMIVAGGGGERPIVAVRSSAKGDLQLGPGEGVSWVIERGSPYLSTPLAYRGLLYVCASNGVLTVYRLETGTLVYRTRLTDAPLTISASPIVAGDRLYFVSDDGDVIVVRAGETFARVAVNRMEEPCFATPAIDGDTLFVRTARHLYAIAGRS
jgi:outer membrane protein assembly factor BamB